MRIVLANRYLYPRGGDATYTLSLARLLRERGHEVICFGQDAPENDPALAAPILADPIDFPSLLRSGGLRSAVAVLARTIYSRHVKGRFAQLLDRARPDIVHLQNIHHHLSPSVIDAAAERRIPVVWTLHDFSVICPNGNLFSKGRPCEECRPARFHRMVVNRCKRGSLPASLMAAAESAVHRAIRVFDRVTIFIAPSRFLMAKLREFDFHPDRVAHLDNFVPKGPGNERARASGAPDPDALHDDYLLFAGRLIRDKGIATLLEAAGRWGVIPLVIAGDGPLREDVLEASDRLPNVRYVGPLDADHLRELQAGALAVVVPSVCYENQPYAVLEAFAAGTPIIGTALGGIPELVGEEERGLLFRPGDPDGLKRAARRLVEDRALVGRLGAAARVFARERLTPRRHYAGLMDLYGKALGREVGRAA